ncbi:hypothetical protein PM082_011029 [Marasmius tenuissimus]|nr:hypothetical protein PM082_011029 [Marasmius tenuissimus]
MDYEGISISGPAKTKANYKYNPPLVGLRAGGSKQPIWRYRPICLPRAVPRVILKWPILLRHLWPGRTNQHSKEDRGQGVRKYLEEEDEARPRSQRHSQGQRSARARRARRKCKRDPGKEGRSPAISTRIPGGRLIRRDNQMPASK